MIVWPFRRSRSDIQNFFFTVEMCSAPQVSNWRTYISASLVRWRHLLVVSGKGSNRLRQTTHSFLSMSTKAHDHRGVENKVSNSNMNRAVWWQKLSTRDHPHSVRISGSPRWFFEGFCSEPKPFRTLCIKEPRAQPLLTTLGTSYYPGRSNLRHYTQ